MKKVHKIVIAFEEEQIVEVPKGSVFLTAQMQGLKLCVWFTCDPTRPMDKRKLSVVGTGHDMIDDCQSYIGTVQIYNGDLIFHVFQRDEIKG